MIKIFLVEINIFFFFLISFLISVTRLLDDVFPCFSAFFLVERKLDEMERERE